MHYAGLERFLLIHNTFPKACHSDSPVPNPDPNTTNANPLDHRNSGIVGHRIMGGHLFYHGVHWQH